MAKKRLCEMMVVTHKGGWANRQDERRNKNGEVMDYHVSYLEVEWKWIFFNFIVSLSVAPIRCLIFPEICLCLGLVSTLHHFWLFVSLFFQLLLLWEYLMLLTSTSIELFPSQSNLNLENCNINCLPWTCCFVISPGLNLGHIKMCWLCLNSRVYIPHSHIGIISCPSPSMN